MNLIKSLLGTPEAIILTGARQVGKSTIIRILIESGIISKHILLNGEDFVSSTHQSSKEFIDYLEIRDNISALDYVIIDEAQQIQHIGMIIKYLVDKRKNNPNYPQCIISGSGSMQMFQGLTDSLIGRYHNITIYPFSFEEYLAYHRITINRYEQLDNSLIKHDIQQSIKHYLSHGGYPAVVTAKTDTQRESILKSLFQDYMQRDIIQFVKTGEIGLFNNLLRLIASNICSMAHPSAWGKVLGHTAKKILYYSNLLEYTYIIFRVESFHGGAVSNEIKKAKKVYMHDTGITSMLLGVHSIINQGPMIENFVAQDLLRSLQGARELRFRQNTNKSEVDFLLINQLSKQLIPIEVKSGDKDNIPKSLINFLDKYHQTVQYAIVTTNNYQGTRSWTQAGKTITIYFCPYRAISRLLNELLISNS